MASGRRRVDVSEVCVGFGRRVSEPASGRLEGAVAPPGQIRLCRDAGRQDESGLGVEALAPAAQEQPDEDRQVDLGAPSRRVPSSTPTSSATVARIDR